jgi:hypothetical protein
MCISGINVQMVCQLSGEVEYLSLNLFFPNIHVKVINIRLSDDTFFNNLRIITI